MIVDLSLQEAIIAKNNLIKNCNIIFISTVNKQGEPNVSYAPTYIDNKCNFYIYISKLAKHTQNIIDTNKISFMILEQKNKNIFAKKRITLNGNIKIINRKTDIFNELMKKMQTKLGDTIEITKNMKDFHLFKITPNSGLLVHGFAKAFIMSGEGLNKVKHLNDIGHTEK